MTKNSFKFADAEAVFGAMGVELVQLSDDIEDIQADTERLVEAKALQAFRKHMRPLFVEHTGLYLIHLNDFPGGLTGSIWKPLGPDHFAAIFASLPDPSAILRSVIAYVDYQGIEIVQEELRGKITTPPRGSRERPTDCVFVPDGHDEVLSELTARGSPLSARRPAMEKLVKKLKQRDIL